MQQGEGGNEPCQHGPEVPALMQTKGLVGESLQEEDSSTTRLSPWAFLDGQTLLKWIPLPLILAAECQCCKYVLISGTQQIRYRYEPAAPTAEIGETLLLFGTA